MDAMALAEAVKHGFRGLDASMLDELRAIRRNGPGRARRDALLAILHLGGEKALTARDLDAITRLVRVKLPRDRPRSIDGCFNSWLTVRGGDQAGIMQVLGLGRTAPATYELGETLVGHLGHGGPEDDERTWRHVFISPRLNGWTVVSGPSCDPDKPHVAGWVEELSARYGDAQSFFYGSQSDGDAWLVGAGGRIVRRFSTEDLATAGGEPLAIERRALEKLGLAGPPESLDDEDTWELLDFLGECGAPQVAAELSIDPVWTGWPAALEVDGQALIAWPAEDDEVSILRGCYTFAV